MAVPFPHGWKSRLFPTSLLDSVNILLAKSLYTIIIMLSKGSSELRRGHTHTGQTFLRGSELPFESCFAGQLNRAFQPVSSWRPSLAALVPFGHGQRPGCPRTIRCEKELPRALQEEASAAPSSTHSSA